jgi:uncharacterized protein (TIRG00374 family)
MLRLWQAVLISLILGILSLWVVLPNLSLKDIRTSVDDFDLRLIPGIISVIIAWWITAGLRTIVLTSRVGSRLNLWQAIQTHVFGVFSSTITPAGGGNSFGIAFLLTRLGLSPQNATAVTVMTLVGDMTFFAWAVPASFVLLTRRGLSLPIENMPLFILGLSALSLTVSYILVFRLPLTTRLVGRLISFRLFRRLQPRATTFLARLGLASERFSTVSWTWHVKFHILSGISRVLYFSTLNLILIALGLDLAQLSVYALQVVIHNFAFIVPTPGASGYQEVAMTYALKEHESSGLVSAAVLLWRLCNHYLYFLVGPLFGGLAILTKWPSKTVSPAKREGP